MRRIGYYNSETNLLQFKVMDKKNPTLSKPGIFLLPNLLTTAGLFFAFYSIVAAMNGKFELASMAVFIALIADAFDGRVARLTNTASDFGAQYDSLADMVSFGLAPALLMYENFLKSLGKLGWLVAFIYTAATALRLARFNTQIGSQDKRYFQGLACPAAAAVMASIVWLTNQERLFLSDWTALVTTLLLAVLQVSNVRYYSFKDIDLKGRVPFMAILVIVVLMVSIAINPPLVLFGGFMIYVVSGPILTLYQLRNRRLAKKSKNLKNTDKG